MSKGQITKSQDDNFELARFAKAIETFCITQNAWLTLSTVYKNGKIEIVKAEITKKNIN